jgi:2'-5' RNA ligase
MSHRLFVGIDLPEAVRESLVRLQGGVRSARWVAPENLHLTVRFIGSVDGAQAQDIHDALCALDARRFTIELRDAGCFGPDRSPRTLWAGVVPSRALDELKVRIDGLLARAGVPPDDRKYAPHITLARLRGGPKRDLGARVAEISPSVGGRFEVDALVLFQSHSSASGNYYTREALYPLHEP